MNSEPLSAPEAIALAGDFHAGARRFAEREKGLARALQMEVSNLRQRQEERRAEIEARHSHTVSALRDKSTGEAAAFEALCRQRRIRLDRAQIAVRNSLIAGLQAQEGQQRATLQRQFMDAARRRDRDVAAADALHSSALESDRNLQLRFQKLEKATVSALRGYGSLQRRFLLSLKDAEPPPSADLAAPPGEEDLAVLHAQLAAPVRRLRSSPLVRWFAVFPPVLQFFLVLAAAASLPLVSAAFGTAVPWPVAIGGAGLIVILLVALWLAGRSIASRFIAGEAARFAEAKSKRLHRQESIEWSHRSAIEEAAARYERVKSSFEEGLKAKSGPVGAPRYPHPEAVEERARTLREKLARHCQFRIDTIHQNLAARIAVMEKKREEDLNLLEEDDLALEVPLEPLERLVAEWERDLLPLANRLAGETIASDRERDFAWFESGPETWHPPARAGRSLAFGEVSYSGAKSGLVLPESPHMGLPVPAEFRLPLRLRIPDAASMLLETKKKGREEAIGLLNLLVLGWLAGSPPGRLSFSLVDPIGLGESFAALMHLADYEEILVNTRIQTRAESIERRLGELCEHMEKVIQMYLRLDYASITEYNEAAGTIAERYHFLVVADFPHGFNETAARRLLSIAAAGARCGVFLLIHCDARAELPQGFRMDDLRKACLCLQSGPEGFEWKDAPVPQLELTLAEVPSPELFSRWIHRVGAANRDSNRIEVPFSHIAPTREECWTLSTAEELRVPIGRSGATKLQHLALGKGTCQHALIAGKTGSGKSTLFHILVSNLALWCDPDEVEFYLIDFKKGVEFKCYADHRLPHARVVAIESDREFGLSVLQRLDEELRHRGEIFRAAGVQDLVAFRERAGSPTLPRSLLLIDEFQEFFTEDDAISQQAAVLLDRIVRQGRAFGIHAVLGSQTLGGAFTLARATLGQMTVRIALACNEADAYLIMDDSNPAPRLLTRPGEGIYNDRAGAAEANSPFQVVWLGEEERERILAEVSRLDRARGGSRRPLVVFEGNAPAEVASDPAIVELLSGAPPEKPGSPRLLLGAPNAIKGPTAVTLARLSANHLLFVGQRDDVIDALVAVSLRLLRAQFGKGIRLILIDGRLHSPDAVDSPFRRAVEAVGEVEAPDPHAIAPLLAEMAAAIRDCAEGRARAPEKSTILFLPNLHRHRRLRYEEDFSFSTDPAAEAKPSDSLQEIILEGSSWGYHLVTSLDSYGNVIRSLGRKAAAEFEKKVLFQMSASDSASLIDSGKAAELGLNRALLHDEAAGTVEIFRPYAMPGVEWF